MPLSFGEDDGHAETLAHRNRPHGFGTGGH